MKPATLRKRRQRERERAAGLARLEILGDPADRAEIQVFADAMQAERHKRAEAIPEQSFFPEGIQKP